MILLTFIILFSALFAITFFFGGQNIFASLLVSFVISAVATIIASKIKKLVEYIKIQKEENDE